MQSHRVLQRMRDASIYNRCQRSNLLSSIADGATVNGTLRDGRDSTLYIANAGTLDNDMYLKYVINGPLATRAWTLQEHVLPQRILHYTSKELLWKCTHCIINENIPLRQDYDLYPMLGFNDPISSQAIEELWYGSLVEDYSKRHLSFGSDKLVAISALVRATYFNRQIDYVAGLWKDCILCGTLWYRDPPGCKSKTFSCPSWSWASPNSTISYRWARHRPYDASMFTPKVVDIRWTPVQRTHSVMSHQHLVPWRGISSVLNQTPETMNNLASHSRSRSQAVQSHVTLRP